MQPQFQNSQADSLLKTGIDQIHNCQFSIAVQTLQTALALYLQVKDYAGIVSTLVNLGVAYRNLRQYSEAIASYQQALDLGRKIGAQPFFIASTLNNLGISYNAHGEFQNALECFQHALPIYRQMHNRRAEANVLANLGTAHHFLHHPEQASDFYQQAIQIAQSLQDLELEVSLRQMMISLPFPQESNPPEEAKQKDSFSVQSLEDQLRQQGRDDTDIVDSLKKLAETYCLEGKYSEAEAIWLRLLEILKQSHGENNLLTGLLLRRMVTFYRSQERYDEAKAVVERSLKIFQQLFDSSHPLIGVSFNDLAGLFHRQGNYKEAETLYLKAIPIMRKVGDSHPDTQNALQNFQYLLQQAREENRISELSDHPFTKSALEHGVPGLLK